MFLTRQRQIRYTVTHLDKWLFKCWTFWDLTENKKNFKSPNTKRPTSGRGLMMDSTLCTGQDRAGEISNRSKIRMVKYQRRSFGFRWIKINDSVMSALTEEASLACFCLRNKTLCWGLCGLAQGWPKARGQVNKAWKSKVFCSYSNIWYPSQTNVI